MKSVLKKSVISTSVSLILASGMAAFAAHAADDVKLKATKTNVAFSDFTPTGLYKLTDLQQKDNLAAANPQVVKEMQGVVSEFINSSKPPLSQVNLEKFNNIKKALSEAK